MIHTRLKIDVQTKSWRLREPFRISRGVQTDAATILVTVTDESGRKGRGEACGLDYVGETSQTMVRQLDEIRPIVERGLTRLELLEVLRAGGARSALDCALWDLEAKQIGQSAFELAGVRAPKPVTTAVTIGIRSLADYEKAARERSNYPVIKVKVGSDDPIAAVQAVRHGAPASDLIVDTNQAWSVPLLISLAPRLAELRVVLLEQPIPVGAEDLLDGYQCPVRLCADELVQVPADLDRAKNRFDVINIKLDKSGGLTAALGLAKAALSQGFSLMAGCMGGSSLSMAPALVLAQECEFADLDGPLLQIDDWTDGLLYADGKVHLPNSSFWG